MTYIRKCELLTIYHVTHSTICWSEQCNIFRDEFDTSDEVQKFYIGMTFRYNTFLIDQGNGVY